MEILSLQQTADLLETATIQQSINEGHAIVHIGINQAGAKFVLINNFMGESVLTESW